MRDGWAAEPVPREPRRIRLIEWQTAGVVESTGGYAETFWLPIIGPTALLMHRRLTRMIGQVTDDEFLAAALGLGQPAGRWSKYGKCLTRLEHFGWIKPAGTPDDVIIAVKTRLPLLSARYEQNLHPQLRRTHAEYLKARDLTEAPMRT